MSVDYARVFRNDEDIKVTTPTLIWELREQAPAVFERVCREQPAIANISERMRTELPVQRSWRFGSFDAYERPDRHVRAVYLKLDAVSEARGALAIKGGEVVCENFEQMIRRLEESFNIYTWSIGGLTRPLFLDYGVINALERFPVIEGKPPGAHPTWDALDEAKSALEFQQAHVARYQEFARVPIPLFVYRWPDEVRDRVRAALIPHLSSRTARAVEESTADGLAAYVYYYPSLPLRLMHIQAPPGTGGAAFSTRMAAVKKHVDIERAVTGWLDTTARMLALGFVGTDPASLNRGYCLLPQNLATDGGMVDINSLRHSSTFRTEGEFRMAFARTIQLLTQCISWLFAGTDAGAQSFAEYVPETFAYVWDDVRERLRSDRGHGAIDPRVGAIVSSSAGTFNNLSTLFESVLGIGEYRPQEREKVDYR